MNKKPDQENNQALIVTQVNNSATKFFLEFGIDSTEICAADIYQVTELIRKNIKHISTTIFNNNNQGINILDGFHMPTLIEELGVESFRLIIAQQKEIIKSVSELCQFIKINHHDPIQIFDNLGITYDHGNLPSACDGIIPFIKKLPEQKVEVKNMATTFFTELKIDYSEINVENPREVTELIKKNIKQISIAIFNNAQQFNNIMFEDKVIEAQKVFGLEAIRLLVNQHNEITKSVSDLCLYVKSNNQEAQPIFDLMGITHTQDNLPSECDGLF